MTAPLVLFVASIWAGAQNALAGGGSFITSSLADADGHGRARRQHHLDRGAVSGPARDRLHRPRRRERPAGPYDADACSSSASLGGGARRARPARDARGVFARLVPWLVLFATALFAWGSFFAKVVEASEAVSPPWAIGAMQFVIAVYGGYFGGGIGLHDDGRADHDRRCGAQCRSAAKNILAGVINASAVAIFVFSADVYWPQALVTAIGASFGGWAGALMLRRVNEKLLKLGVVAIGVALTIGLFWTAP